MGGAPATLKISYQHESLITSSKHLRSVASDSELEHYCRCRWGLLRLQEWWTKSKVVSSAGDVAQRALSQVIAAVASPLCPVAHLETAMLQFESPFRSFLEQSKFRFHLIWFIWLRHSLHRCDCQDIGMGKHAYLFKYLTDDFDSKLKDAAMSTAACG